MTTVQDIMKLLGADIVIDEKIKHEGDKWNVYNKAGTKLLGSHDTEEQADKQLAAIEISKAKRGK